MRPFPFPTYLTIPNMKNYHTRKGRSQCQAAFLTYLVAIPLLIPLMFIYATLVGLFILIVFVPFMFVLAFIYAFRVPYNVLKILI